MAKLQNSINQSTVNSSIVTQSATPFTTAVGSQALQSTTATNCTAVGYQALKSSTTGINCTAVGSGALATSTTANHNTACGYFSLESCTGVNNTAVGDSSGFIVSTGGGNVGIGSSSLGVTTGSNNVAVGYLASGAGGSYTSVVAVGHNSLNTATGNSNCAVGDSAASHLITGTNNLVVGTSAGSAYTGSESSNILIGSPGTLGESHAIHIGNFGGGAGQQTTCFIAGVGNNAITGNVLTQNSITLQVGIAGGIITAPPTSNAATSTFGSTLTLGTALQNTNGYDILVNAFLQISSSVGGSIVAGVGGSSTPTTNTVTGAFTTATPTFISFSAIVPSSYYLLINTSGAVTVSSVTLFSSAL